MVNKKKGIKTMGRIKGEGSRRNKEKKHEVNE